MSRSPGTILESIDVPFDFPRTPELRADPEFARLTGIVSGHLRSAADLAVADVSAAEGTA
jgi:NitT/TauT family transport system ATP-binding protein